MTTVAAAPSDQPKPANRLFVAIGLLLSSLLTALLAAGGNLYVNAYQSARAERMARVDKFVQASNEFAPLVKTLVADEVKGNVYEKTIKSIRSNLIQQHQLLDDVKASRSPDVVIYIEKYQNILADADEHVKSVHTAIDTGPFAQDATNLSENRDDLFAKLRRPPSLILTKN